VVLHHFKRLLNKLSEDKALPLRVVDAVAHADSALLKEIEHGQDLAVVWDQTLPNRFVACHQHLDYLKRNRDDLRVPSVKSS
jgi:hypothetical protein